ncbi:MAG TPA: AtpZ/AtpI family protein [Candidatus Paceibacterota bacterium]
MEEVKKDNNQKKRPVPATKAELIAFAFEVGYSVAIPLAILAFGGRWLDRQMDTTPTFLVIGLLLSIVSTSIIIWRKVRTFL